MKYYVSGESSRLHDNVYSNELWARDIWRSFWYFWIQILINIILNQLTCDKLVKSKDLFLQYTLFDPFVDALCSSCVPKLLFSCCFWLGYCNSSLNPFIYASTSREFKRTFAKILCARRRLTVPPRAFSSTPTARNNPS